MVKSVSLVSSVTLGVVCAADHAEKIARMIVSIECRK
jgi:hypothetical protein